MKDKKIEGMARDLCKHSLTEYCASGRCQNPNCLVNAKALETLYAKGYRKAADVREIFEEIEKMLISNHIESYMTLDDTWIHRFKNSILINLNELKKKYTESEKDNG